LKDGIQILYIRLNVQKKKNTNAKMEIKKYNAIGYGLGKKNITKVEI